MRNLKRALSLVIASVMLLGMMVVGASATAFEDEDQIVNKEAVEITAGLGLFAGTDGKFLPQDNVTRAQMATIIVKMLYGSEINADQYKGVEKFSDTAAFEGGWAEGYINLCANLGIVSGYGDGTYRPGQQVTTAEAATMIINALGVDAGKGTWPLTVMAKAEEMKLFDELTPKPGTNVALVRDQLASIVLQGLNYSPAGTNGYKVPGVSYVFTSYADALQAATSLGCTAADIAEIVGEDTLANKTFGMKSATGMITDNVATDPAINYTLIDNVPYNIETGLDDIGHVVTVYYKDEYKSEKEPGTAYCVVDKSTVVTVTTAIKDATKFRAAFGTKELSTAGATVFDGEYVIDEEGTLPYNYAAKTASVGTYVIYDGAVVSYRPNATVYADKVSKVTSSAIHLSGAGELKNTEAEDVVVEYDGIQVGDIVTYIKVGDIYNLTKVDAIEGKVTRLSGDKKKATVNGKVYSAFTATNNNVPSATKDIPTDFDITYKMYVTADNKIVFYEAVSGQANLSNIVYVANVYAVAETDHYGNDLVSVNAQVINMDGKLETILVASYKQNGRSYEPTEESNGKTSALKDGEFGMTFDTASGKLTGTVTPGFYTFKKSDNSKLANLGIQVATPVSGSYAKNDVPYVDSTKMVGKDITSKTAYITTNDGTAYLTDDTKFIVYAGAGASLTATVATGKMAHTFTEESAVLLSRNANGNRLVEVVIINMNPDDISTGEYVYVGATAPKYKETLGFYWEVYTSKGESKVIPTESETLERGFHTYSVDAEGVYTLTPIPATNGHLVLGTIFETIYNDMLVTVDSESDVVIDNYDASNAVVIDVRGKTDKLESLQDLIDRKLQAEEGKKVNIKLDVYVERSTNSVELIFVTDVAEIAEP